MSEYTCAGCGGVFTQTRPDSEALEERAALFPDEEAAGAAFEVVCDDCFKSIMAFHGRAEDADNGGR